MLDRRWFHNKRCLDIGCNEGVITLAVVQRFAPLSMLGVDIDEGLVKAACRYHLFLFSNAACDVVPKMAMSVDVLLPAVCTRCMHMS